MNPMPRKDLRNVSLRQKALKDNIHHYDYTKPVVTLNDYFHKANIHCRITAEDTVSMTYVIV